MRVVEQGLKAKFAKLLGLCRTRLYRHSTRQAERDAEDVETLTRLHDKYPKYGVERLALQLAWSINKTRRIRNLAGITIKYGKKKCRQVIKPEIPMLPNLLRPFWKPKDPKHPEKGYSFEPLTDPKLNIWVHDFTYIWWKGRFYYLAAVMRLSTREIIGYSLSYYHDAEMVVSALDMALSQSPPPSIDHGDQGAEYRSKKYADLCKAYNIQLSASAPGEPTQNGFMESFFSSFKNELREEFAPSASLAELYEKIALWIYDYNNNRIHTALKMSPKAYASLLDATDQQLILSPTALK